MTSANGERPEGEGSPPTDSFDFDSLQTIEVPVKVEGKCYVLREASAEDARQWRNRIFRITQMKADGKTKSVEGIADVETELVQLCLYEVPEVGKEKRVHISIIRSWKNRIVRALFQEAKRISQLGEFDPANKKALEEAEEEATQQEQDEEEPERPPPPKRRTMWE